MSSLPVLLNLLNEMGHDDPLFFGHDFGLGLQPQHLHHNGNRHHHHHDPTGALTYASSVPLSRQLSRREGAKEGGKHNHIGKDGFQVCMDVAQFKPSELSVKVVDNCIVVEGRHEEREDNHGHISRHFLRRYSLPKEYHPEKVQSTLSSDGVLTVSIPKPAIEDVSNERVVQIQQVGPAHLNVKHNAQEKIGDATNGEDAAK